MRALRMKRIQINRYYQGVIRFSISFAITNDLVITRFSKYYVPGSLQGSVLFAYTIQPRYDITYTSVLLPIPVFYLVLLIIYVLFLAWHRRGKSVLVNRPIQPIVGRHGCCQYYTCNM